MIFIIAINIIYKYIGCTQCKCAVTTSKCGRSEIKSDLGITTILELRTGFLNFFFTFWLNVTYIIIVIIFQLNISVQIPFLNVWILYR